MYFLTINFFCLKYYTYLHINQYVTLTNWDSVLILLFNILFLIMANAHLVSIYLTQIEREENNKIARVSYKEGNLCMGNAIS